MLDSGFVAIVRSHLRLLSPEQPLDPDARLDELGLDSMTAMALMFELEDAYEATLADEELLAGVFRTAATLWAAVSAARVT